MALNLGRLKYHYTYHSLRLYAERNVNDSEFLFDVNDIDEAIISMYIKETTNQSLNELAVRLGMDLNYKFESVLNYLKSHQLYTYESGLDPYTGLLKYGSYEWYPGDFELVYKRYLHQIDKFKNK